MANQPETLRESKTHGTLMLPLAVYEIADTADEVRHHWHKEIELIYMERGHYLAEINMERISDSRPAFFFVNKEELHYLSIDSDCREYAVLFDLSMLASESYDGVQQKLVIPLLGGTLKFPRRIDGDSKAGMELKEIFRSIMREKERDTLSSYLRIKSSLFEMMAVLEEHGLLVKNSPDQEESQPKVIIVKTVLSYIREHYRDKIYVRDLAGLVSLNEQYLCRFFKKAINKTLVEYIVEYRIEQAARVIAESDRSMTDICFSCGFENMGYFIRRFKELKGFTPSAYRDAVKSQNSVTDAQNWSRITSSGSV